MKGRAAAGPASSSTRRAPAGWSVYLVRCADGTLYCGIARDVGARIAAHEAGKGARYTRGRGPLTLLVVRRCRQMGTALRIELAIKGLPRSRKLALAQNPDLLTPLVRSVLRRKPYMS
jgi:putative endonuclease